MRRLGIVLGCTAAAAAALGAACLIWAYRAEILSGVVCVGLLLALSRFYAWKERQDELLRQHEVHHVLLVRESVIVTRGEPKE